MIAGSQPDHDRNALFLRCFLAAERRVLAFILTRVPHPADARRFYADAATVWACLARLSASHDISTAPAAAPGKIAAMRSPSSRRLALLARYAVAAAIIVAFTAAVSLLVSQGRSAAAHRSAPPIAMLVDAAHARWGPSDVPTDVGAQLPGGTLRLQSGTATLEFYSGARVRLVGPAEFGLNSTMRGFLRRGSLTAYVPTQAHGFTIGAPGLAVVDLGTKFHLAVDSRGASRVNVLRGKVRIDVLDDTGNPIRRSTLVQNEAVALDASRRLVLVPAPVRTRPLLVINPSFEADGGNTYTPTGWTSAFATRAGAEDRVTDHLIKKGYDGRQIGFVNARQPHDPRGIVSSLEQVVTRAVPGTTYTLRVNVGIRTDKATQPASNWRFALEDAATGRELAARSGKAGTPGELQGQSVRWTAGPDDAGIMLRIRLSNPSDAPAGDGQVNFDNVRLDATEPVTDHSDLSSSGETK